MSVLSGNRADALGALGDPMRRRVYDVVARAHDAVGRDAAAAAAGIPRSTVAFHLDRLVEAGLLTVEYRRLSGRSGPGAGRPAKLYRAVAGELVGSIPERHYEVAGDLLASAAERADRDGVPMRDAVTAQAHELGAQLGHDAGTVEGALTSCGYAPEPDGQGGLMLGNCPFHVLAARHTDLICGANLALVQGIVGAVDDPRTPHLIPRDGHCCVEIRAAQAEPDGGAVREHPTRSKPGSP